MENYAKLIHKANTHFLPTKLPAQFYGMPNGKVVIVYSRFYEKKFDDTGLEFVFATHKDFSFDYEQNQLIERHEGAEFQQSNEMVDKPEPNYKINKVYRKIDSYTKAFNKLNKKAYKQILKRENATHDFKEPAI